MKKMLLVTGLLVSGLAQADIDYSRCMYSAGLSFQGVTITNDGKVEPQEHMVLKSAHGDGKTESYTFAMKEKSPFMGGANYEVTVTVERDEQGRIIRAGTGGDKPDQKLIDMWKNYYAQPLYGGWGRNSGPVYNIDGKKIPLEKVTKEQAKEAGFAENLDQFRKLNSARRKDKKTLKKMKETYSKIHAKADYVIPFGSEAEFDFKDGVCMTKSTSSKNYSTKTKEVTKQLISSREGCEEVQKLYKKYETKLNECSTVQQSLNNEYYENFYKKKMQNNPYGGMYGGMAGGMAGGIAGGYVTGGMGGGVVVGGFPGQNTGLIQSELWSCEYTYGVGKIGLGIVGGSQSGTLGNSEASQQ